MATVWSINNLYIGLTTTLTFSLWSSRAADSRYQIHLLSDILTFADNSNLAYVIELGENLRCEDPPHLRDNGVHIEGECTRHKYVIVMIDSLESFRRFKNELSKENYIIQGYYTIIYTGEKQRYFEVFCRMIDELFRQFMLNVNIYIEMPGETLVYTYFPFSKFHCRGSHPVLLNRYTPIDGFMFDKPFFPKKSSNFFGCPLTVATWSSPPFIYFRNTQRKGLKVYGIEGELIKMLSTSMNFRIKFLLTNRRGRIYPNLTTADGAFKLVLHGPANISINSFVYTEFALKTLFSSYTYTSYEIVVAIPKGHPLSALQRLTKPFKYIIWSCLSSSVLAGILIILAIQCLRRRKVKNFVFGPFNSIPLTNLLNVFFGGPVTVLPRRNFARYILLVWLVYTFILRSAYSGELFIMLQDSSSTTTFQTVEEMIKNNFTFWCSDNAIEYVIKGTNTRLLKVIPGPPFKYFAKLQDSSAKVGIVTLRPYVRIYNRVFHPLPPIQTLPSKFITAPLTMYFRKNSYLLDVVNYHLLRYAEAGMLESWDKFYLSRNKEQIENKEPTVLSVHLLLGLFSAYLLFLGFSFLTFLLELWSKQSPICRSVMNFLNL